MAIMKIPASWGEQFHLSISNESGHIETMPERIKNDGEKQSMGESIRCDNTKELLCHLMEFECGNLARWKEHY